LRVQGGASMNPATKYTDEVMHEVLCIGSAPTVCQIDPRTLARSHRETPCEGPTLAPLSMRPCEPEAIPPPANGRGLGAVEACTACTCRLLCALPLSARASDMGDCGGAGGAPVSQGRSGFAVVDDHPQKTPRPPPQGPRLGRWPWVRRFRGRSWAPTRPKPVQKPASSPQGP
jgi:hypothetical protein